MDKESLEQALEIEKMSFEKLLSLAGRDPDAIKKRRKKEKTADDIALEEYIRNHPDDPDPIGSYVLRDV